VTRNTCWSRSGNESVDGVDLLIQSGRTIDAIRMDGWRIDVGYPEDRDKAEGRLEGETVADDRSTAEASTDASAE
jgi:glucose-1-phosphate thymidylyltransferase